MKNYGQIPFWSWNGLLKEEKLKNQMLEMKKLGFGGFFMHARGGLKTEYLSDDWFDKIKYCIDESSNLDMKPWAYDENGWPSGFADGHLLKDGYYISFLELKENIKYNCNALGNYKKIGDNFVCCSEDDGGEYYVINIVYNKTYVDLMNPNVAKEFVNLIYEKYKEKFGNKIEGFFTDEPQYSRDGIPWSLYLKEEYETRTNRKIADDLIYLFFDNGDISKKIRYDYYNIASDLFINFQKYIYDWCVKNGYQITGHTIDENCIFGQIACCGEAMRFYEYETIPGIDWLTKQKGTNLAQKQCSSVAEQLGKEQVLTETFAASGWDSSIEYLKRNVDFQLANGINLFCYHLYPYSIIGERKHDFPPFFSEHCSWMKNSVDFHRYIKETGELLGEGKKNTKVLVIHTILSAYMTFRRYEPESVLEMQQALDKVCDYLTSNCIQYHLGSEKIIAKYGSVSGKRFHVGYANYEYVIVPEMTNLTSETYALLKEYIRNGGKVIILGNKLKYKDGIPFEFDIKSNACLEDVKSTREIYLKTAENIYSYFAEYVDKKVFFVFNNGDAKIKTKIITQHDIVEYDAISGKFFNVIDNNLELHPNESKTYFLGTKTKGIERFNKSHYLSINNKFSIKSLNNYLPLDIVQYSFDGKNYFESTNVLELKKHLLSKRYEGDLFLKYTFYNNDFVGKMLFVSEPNNKIEVFVNGKKANKSDVKVIDDDMQCFSINSELQIGKNEIVQKIYYYQREEVYYVLFTDGVSETLKNKLVYDTELDASYLYGEFKVNFFCNEINNATRRIEKFSISKMSDFVNLQNLSEDGFPFIAGEIVVATKIPKIKGVLVADFSVQTVGVYVNDVYCGQLFGFNEVEIDARNVENELKFVIDFNMRNLFGPFHMKDNEPLYITPDSFYEIENKDIYSIVDQKIENIKIFKDEYDKN